jgi:hypothetical protein
MADSIIVIDGVCVLSSRWVDFVLPLLAEAARPDFAAFRTFAAFAAFDDDMNCDVVMGTTRQRRKESNRACQPAVSTDDTAAAAEFLARTRVVDAAQQRRQAIEGRTENLSVNARGDHASYYRA